MGSSPLVSTKFRVSNASLRLFCYLQCSQIKLKLNKKQLEKHSAETFENEKEDGAFYIITHGLSNKRKHIRKNSNVPYAATGLQRMVRAAIWGRSVKRKTEKSPTNYVLHFRRGSIMDIITLMMKTPVFSVFN